jgi:hypothetical protein
LKTTVTRAGWFIALFASGVAMMGLGVMTLRSIIAALS